MDHGMGVQLAPPDLDIRNRRGKTTGSRAFCSHASGAAQVFGPGTLVSVTVITDERQAAPGYYLLTVLEDPQWFEHAVRSEFVLDGEQREFTPGTFCSVARSGMDGVIVGQHAGGDVTFLHVYVEFRADVRCDQGWRACPARPCRHSPLLGQVWQLKFPGDVLPFDDPEELPRSLDDIDVPMTEAQASEFRERARAYAAANSGP